MSGSSLNAVLFLIGLLFNFYIVILIVRLILAWVGAEYTHPVTQFVVRTTSAIVVPMKKFLPDIRGFETATLVLIFVVEMIKFFIITSLSFGLPNIIGLIILSLADTLRLILEILSLALVLQMILSVVQPSSSIYQILNKFTAPVIKPLQKFIPPVAGVDISPIPAIIIMQLIIILALDPMKARGLAMAIGA